MSNDTRPIVVKRIKKVTHGHHGGAWKIAYADFVTAMMAFFLLMWLLGSTTSGDLKGIADYFSTPLKVAMLGGKGSGDATSIVTGGGMDLSRTHGQIKRGENPPAGKFANQETIKAQMAREDAAQLGKLKERFVNAIEANERLAAVRNQVKVDLTGEGLRIQIVDEQNRPMFDTGSARLKDYTREILREVAGVLNGVSSKIALSGHTDATPYTGGDRGYSNWELSADRANASRRDLLAAGLAEDKVLRVVGLAASMPLVRNDPIHPSNRRISIVVLSKQAEEQFRAGGGGIESAPPVPAALPPAAARR